MGSKLEYLMSKLRLTARCLRESNGDTFNCMGGLVHVGGVVRTGGRNGRRGVGEVWVTGGVTRGGGYNSGACGSGSVPSRIDPADGGQGRGTSRGGARRCRRSRSKNRSRSRSVSRSRSKSKSSLDSSVRTCSPTPSPTSSEKKRQKRRSRSGSYREESGERRVKETGPRAVFNSDSE